MNLPTHTASEVLLQLRLHVTSPLTIEQALSTLEADLLAVIGPDEEVLLNYRGKPKNIMQDINLGMNKIKEQQRIALLQYMGTSGLAHGTDSGSRDKSGASDE